uniref:Uncharacterized protein n=1 Tax=Macrostomum lignano TaxID=282301 RepID=A0A1I8J1T2_9PLAT
MPTTALRAGGCVIERCNGKNSIGSS